jgi:uroporphyrinogen decarboxylase
MKRNMYEWLKLSSGVKDRKALPVMTYPGLGLTGKNVMDVISNGQNQFECIEALAKKYPSIATVTIMDLSVEAEAFGSKIRFSNNEVPTVINTIVSGIEDAKKLVVPKVGAGRTGCYLDAAKKASEKITDRPVLGGVIGPLSLAGRLIGVSEIMLTMIDEPETVHIVLEKCTTFLKKYAEAFKAAGANGILIAEPVAGLMSPKFCDEFSSQYVKKIVDELQDKNFAVILHNCGNTVKLVDSMVSTGAAAFHFGNAVKMIDIMPQLPSDRVAFGNIEPAGIFKIGSPEKMKQMVTDLLNDMKPYDNFVLSSGCDVPPGTSLENIDAFFEALNEFNSNTKTN